MRYRRMAIEVESPEQLGYGGIRHNLAESSVGRSPRSRDLGVDVESAELVLLYGDHLGTARAARGVAARRIGPRPDDVLVTADAAAALFIVATTLLERGRRTSSWRARTPPRTSRPAAIGADVDVLDLALRGRLAVDPDRIAALLRPERGSSASRAPQPHRPRLRCATTLDAVVGLVERATGGGPARGRDVPGTRRREPLPGRAPCPSGSSACQPVEGVRPAGAPRRVAGDSRPALRAAVARRQGAGAHQRRR